MFVIQKDPEQCPFSGWKGCLWVDPETDQAWYATNLAKPSLFLSMPDRELKLIRKQFPGANITVAIYEQLFQEELAPKPIQKPAPPTITPEESEISSWNWNDDGDDIPF